VKHVAQFDAGAALDRQPRHPFARLPTPLHEAVRLREALGGELRCPRILLKRDDLTDLALGGNKARKLEFIVGDALHRGFTALVTTGAVQSNHARMTAAAASIAGLRCALVLAADVAEPDVQGNLLLDRLLGADIHFWQAGDDDDADSREQAAVDGVMDALREAGESPLFVPVGGSTPVGTLGYVQATRELTDQLAGFDPPPTRLYYASGSRGTQAGLVLGARLFGAPWQCIGIAVSGGEAIKRERATAIANEAALLLDCDISVEADQCHTEQHYFGTGYAVPTPAGMEALALLARTEGVLLDPVYTAKAMAGMIDHISSGAIDPRETILFLHTGGSPGMFGHAARIAPMLTALRR
jgi:D-cysteine desulfhydrase family pyridoxal phosphate-dependent enzyme